MKNLVRSEEGQGMTEYIIIVALIAIAAIGVITVFGQNLRALFASSASMLGGASSAETSKMGGAGKDIKTGKKNLASFANTKR
jgi:Flp pilus assembly pilin Flp